MKQWLTIYQKEMLEMWRNYKWIWIPLVFILFGMMQPIITYYMPTILDAVGGLPEGAVIDIPLPTGAEVMAKTLSQYGTLGVLILVLSFMGIVSSERDSGVAGLIMVKPVSHMNYITAKWMGAFSVTAVSFLMGYLASWYYTNLLVEKMDFYSIVYSFVIYLLWLFFIITVTLFMSTIVKANGAIAFLTILVIAGLSILTKLLSKYMSWSPATLSNHAGRILTTGGIESSFYVSVMITLLLIVALIFGSIQFFKSTFHTA